MRTIYVEGGSLHKRKLAENAAIFAYNQLIPKIKNCSIDIFLNNLDNCFEIEDREYEININNKQNGDDFLTAIFHEIVHVKQYIRKQYKNDEGLNYLDKPSEKEAYKLQEELLEKWKKY